MPASSGFSAFWIGVSSSPWLPPLSRPLVPVIGLAIIYAIAGGIFVYFSRVLKKNPKYGINSLRYLLVRDAGIAALIVAGLTITTDASLTLHREKQHQNLVKAYADLTVPKMLETSVGKELAGEIQRQILDPAFQYTDYEVEADFDYATDEKGPYLFGDVSTKIIVQNIARVSSDYALRQQLTDLTRKPHFRTIQMQELDDRLRASSA